MAINLSTIILLQSCNISSHNGFPFNTGAEPPLRAIAPEGPGWNYEGLPSLIMWLTGQYFSGVNIGASVLARGLFPSV